MPIKLPKDIPAFQILKKKNVFVMDEKRAKKQAIRPLRIGIVNLMPTKEETETQIFRMIGSGPIQLEPVLIKMRTYQSKNVSKSHMDKFYIDFEEAKKEGLDGLIITGASVELMQFEDVAYWDELVKIMEWAKDNITSTLLICWAAQACLYHFYGLNKKTFKNKKIGIFKHSHVSACPIPQKNNKKNNDFVCQDLLRGIDDELWIPHARYTEIPRKDILKINDLKILIDSKEAGPHLIINRDASFVLAMGHFEYDRHTLDYEYKRDLKKGLNIKVPKNYYVDNDATKLPKLNWRANAGVFYRNWINFIYQTTNYDIKKYRMNT